VLLRLAGAAALLGLAGCGGSSDTAATTTSSLPAGCSVEQVDAIVTAFLAKPDLAPPSFFQTYAAYDSDGRAFLTKRRSEALTHLRARLAVGERDRLISLRVAPEDVNHVRDHVSDHPLRARFQEAQDLHAPRRGRRDGRLRPRQGRGLGSAGPLTGIKLRAQMLIWL
jgi:hypothetical protein